MSFLNNLIIVTIYIIVIIFFPDNAYACDPRIKKFRDDEREKKAAEKRAKQEAAKAAVAEKERVKKC